MTDNEIINGLRYCLQDNEDCFKCPLYNKDLCPNSITKAKAYLDLINRQKEDIEELEAIVDLRSKRRYYQKFVKEVYQKEKGNELSYPDFDYIYKLYFDQKAEIERLQKSNGEMFVTISKQDAEIERLQNESIGTCQLAIAIGRDHNNGDSCSYCLDTLKNEVIKDFDERLKEKAHFSEDFGEAAVACYDIDIVVKEMTEGQND